MKDHCRGSDVGRGRGGGERGWRGEVGRKTFRVGTDQQWRAGLWLGLEIEMIIKTEIHYKL